MIFRLDVSSFTEQGKRPYQEDSFYCDAPSVDTLTPWLGVVSDGMGGHQGGDIASQAGVQAIRESFKSGLPLRTTNGQNALVSAVTSGQLAVMARAIDMNALGDMGATVVGAMVFGDMLTWCSAGDSRLYLIRSSSLIQLTRDFTVGEDLRRSASQGDWTDEEILAHPQQGALTSFMGAENWRYDVGQQKILAGDVLLLCSDGVYGTIVEDELRAICQGEGFTPDAHQIAEQIRQRILTINKPRQDNSTAIVVCVKQGG